MYADTDNMEYIEKVTQDDLLSMEEKEKLVKRINEVKNNKEIIQEWMVVENNRMREENVLRTAREDGLKEGLKKGIQEEKLQLIRKMLQRGDSYEDISEITGKTILEIKEIESNM